MGSVKKDLYTRALALEAQYPLDTSDGVYALLSDIYHVKNSRFYKGDIIASDILVDLIIAVANVKFTDRQKQALYLVFLEDLTQREAALQMDCTQQAVQQHVWAAVKKISKQFNGEIPDDNEGEGTDEKWENEQRTNRANEQRTTEKAEEIGFTD